MSLSTAARDQVATLRVLLLDGDIVPGEAIAYADLTDALGADADAVAAAVRELGRDGFVELLREGRFMILPHEVEDVDEVVAVRLLVEPAAVRRAAAAVRLADLIPLREMVREVEAAMLRADYDQFHEAHEDFYATLLTLLPNRRLAELVLDLRRRTRMDGARQVVEAGFRMKSGPSLVRLVRLIEAGDLDGVEALMHDLVAGLRYLGAPRRERGEPWPVYDTYPEDMVPMEGLSPPATGWAGPA